MLPVQVSATPGLRRTAILRRYMDLAKLLDLLHSKSLYLRRADGFADRLEGALFPAFRRSMDESHARGELDHGADYFYRRARLGSYVSCWTIGAGDNMALWQLYGGTRTSVAVTTTVEQLIRVCLGWGRSSLLQKVEYVDHLKKKTFVIGRYTDTLQYKNTAYSYEDELRVIVPAQNEGWEDNPIGLRVPVPSLDELVRSVVVAPEADRHFKQAVEDLCRKYGLQAPVRRSKLSVVPT